MNDAARLLALASLLTAAPGFGQSQARIDYALAKDGCRLSAEWHQKEHFLRLRTIPTQSDVCEIRVDQLLNAIEQSIGEAEILDTLNSIYLGRLIDYPELSSSLMSTAREDTFWNRKTGKPETESDNAYVARILSKSDFAKRLDELLGREGLRVKNTAVEKVLIKIFGNGGANFRLPYDAQVWIGLERK